MLRLKLIIQERSDYLPAIQYISWIIRIKLQFKRQLLTKRSSIRKEQISLRAEATSVKNDIRTETGKLELLAETVRYYWAKPIAYLNADICYNSILGRRIAIEGAFLFSVNRVVILPCLYLEKTGSVSRIYSNYALENIKNFLQITQTYAILLLI